jgi:hypothetical protein
VTIEHQTRNLAQRLFRQKRARRRALAALSFPEKISLLVRLQHIASDIRTVARRKTPPPWKIKN